MKITVIRMNASLRKAIPLLLLFVLLCFQSHAQQASVTLDRVASFMQAYNAHDIDAMLLNMSDDVKWFNVAFSDKNGITTSQCAMSIYQLSQGLIISITYYAAAKC